MRIVFLDQYSDLAGAQLCLRDVLEEVSSQGWQAEVMAPGTGPLLDFTARARGFGAKKPLHLTRYLTAPRPLPTFCDLASIWRAARTCCAACCANTLRISSMLTAHESCPQCPDSKLRSCFTPHKPSWTSNTPEPSPAGFCAAPNARVLACSEFTAQPT